MTRRSCDGVGLLAAFRAAAAHLERYVDEINALNVYPVPDGDTGSNMLATLSAALEEAEAVAGQPADRIATAISFGSLMGARGNSGVIASQIFRGMAEGLGGKRRFDGLDLAHALSVGSATAYGAVAKPVEGTILTVIREAAVAAVAAAEKNNDIEAVLGATVDAAERAVAKTPTMLAILREAGVVDAGGEGLYRLFQGALLHVVGATPVGVATERRGAAKPSTLVARADEGFGYETMFLVQAHLGQSLDVDAVRDHLQEIGESVLVAGDARALKVHVHNERPDEVIAYGLSLGTLSRISVENLDRQARDVRERRATEFAGVGDMVVEFGPDESAIDESAVAVGVRTEPADRFNGHHPNVGDGTGLRGTGLGGTGLGGTGLGGTALEPTPIGPAVVAVVAGDGLAAVYESFGVERILRGGQSNNPSIGELLGVARMAKTRDVLLLPNNSNVRLAAEQAARVCKDRRIVVVPTRNCAEGLGALIKYDPRRTAAENVGPMTEAARAIQTLQVADAVRGATIGGRKVRQGQTIVLDPDDGLVAVDTELAKAILAALATLDQAFELLTVYYGNGADLAEAEGLGRRIGAWRPDVEVEIVHGGQPHYRYLISAE